MQYMDYGKCRDMEGIASEVKRLKDKGLLTAEETAAVDMKKIYTLFSSDFGMRILNADKLYREFKFSLLTPGELNQSRGGGRGNFAAGDCGLLLGRTREVDDNRL